VGTPSLEARNVRLVNIITYIIAFIIACVSFSVLENDTLNQAELNEIKMNENN
jgi:hypothetical protein